MCGSDASNTNAFADTSAAKHQATGLNVLQFNRFKVQLF
jgi:hypothetical protein